MIAVTHHRISPSCASLASASNSLKTRQSNATTPNATKVTNRIGYDLDTDPTTAPKTVAPSMMSGGTMIHAYRAC